MFFGVTGGGTGVTRRGGDLVGLYFLREAAYLSKFRIFNTLLSLYFHKGDRKVGLLAIGGRFQHIVA